MTTLAKIEANQRNGQLSTGPQTVEGKAVVARNATKHGIFAAVPVVPGDDRDERIAKYERHLHSLLTSTLHELERLQARRGGEPVPLPAVADLSVAVEVTG